MLRGTFGVLAKAGVRARDMIKRAGRYGYRLGLKDMVEELGVSLCADQQV